LASSVPSSDTPQIHLEPIGMGYLAGPRPRWHGPTVLKPFATVFYGVTGLRDPGYHSVIGMVQRRFDHKDYDALPKIDPSHLFSYSPDPAHPGGTPPGYVGTGSNTGAHTSGSYHP
jgi:hypothetical protein